MAFRVLVVDDAAFVRDTIKRNLRPIIPDAEIVEANNGRKAISAIRLKAVDVILSDWEMPEMSGEDFLKWLREQPEFEKTPFIMVTSRGDREHVVSAVKAGVSDFLTKPFTPDELHKKVGKQLKRLGYKPPQRGGQSVQSSASSLDVLTGGTTKKTAPKQSPPVVSAAGFGKPAAKASPKPKASASKSRFKGRAFLRFPKTSSPCSVRELSLQALNGTIARPDAIPAVFDQVVIDLENASGEALARINGYIHAVLADEPRPDCETLKITVRFVDNDPDKFEALSKAIAGM